VKTGGRNFNQTERWQVRLCSVGILAASQSDGGRLLHLLRHRLVSIPGKPDGRKNSMARAETDSPKPSPRRLPIVSVLLALLLLGFALFGDRGILRALQAGRQKAALQEEVRQLEAANAELRQEIESLRNDRRYLEAIARRELGMVKDDELVYQFRSVLGAARPAGPARPADKKEASPAPGQ
jgi:cell division protein FtsB